MQFIIANVCVMIYIGVIIATPSSIKPHQMKRSAATCGFPSGPTGYIVRGHGFSRGDFPWIVALMQTKTPPISFFCGGTLISSTFVLTAAHCIREKHSIEPFLHRDIFALFGAHDLRNPYEVEKISLSPKKIMLHDDWNPHITEYDADIALLEFEAGKVIGRADSLYIRPICLWNSEMDATVKEGIVTGWGKSEDPTKAHENKPRLIKVSIQSNEECIYGDRELFDLTSSRTFCAGLQNGSGVCHGDSGGGLFIEMSGVYYLKGIVSSSLVKHESCDVSRNAVYTDVMKFRDWIDQKTRVVPTSPRTRITTVASRKPVYQTLRTTVPTPVIVRYSTTQRTAAASTTTAQQVFCNIETVQSKFLRRAAITCAIDQNIDNDDYVIGSSYDSTVESFLIQNTSVASIPRQIGAKFPNLYDFQVYRSRITVVRSFFFEGMTKLEYMALSSFSSATIETGAFKDLISLKKLFLDCGIETLEQNVFAAMINLEEIYLNNNQLKVLSPTTFNISGGKLRFVNLQSNFCIDKFYWLNELPRLEADIAAKCQGRRNG